MFIIRPRVPVDWKMQTEKFQKYQQKYTVHVPISLLLNVLIRMFYFLGKRNMKTWYTSWEFLVFLKLISYWVRHKYGDSWGIVVLCNGFLRYQTMYKVNVLKLHYYRSIFIYWICYAPICFFFSSSSSFLVWNMMLVDLWMLAYGLSKYAQRIVCRPYGQSEPIAQIGKIAQMGMLFLIRQSQFQNNPIMHWNNLLFVCWFWASN